MVVMNKKEPISGLQTPTSNGDYGLVELVGNVVFKMLISLGGKKQILHDINLYADKGQKMPLLVRRVQVRRRLLI